MKNAFESWHILNPLDCPKKSQGISGIKFSLLGSGGLGGGGGGGGDGIGVPRLILSVM